jgi:hypothetical protein
MFHINVWLSHRSISAFLGLLKLEEYHPPSFLLRALNRLYDFTNPPLNLLFCSTQNQSQSVSCLGLEVAQRLSKDYPTLIWKRSICQFQDQALL